MPKRARELTAIEVKNLKAGTWAVGQVQGLYIRKSDTNSFFFLRYSDPSGKRRDYTLGNYPDVSLKQAREMARKVRDLLTEGKDPIQERQNLRAQRKKQQEEQDTLMAPDIVSFEQIAMEWVKDRAGNGYWRQNAKGEKETVQILRKHVFPHLGHRDIETITPEDIRKGMEPIWQKIPSTAKKARTYINKIFQWAIALHKRENRENPADMKGALGVLMEPLQKNRKAKQNHAACSVSELPRLMKEIHGYDSMSARSLEFAILTTARSQAVRLARWEEFDLENGIWIIPLEHDKIKTPKRDRTVFLSSYALRLLNGLVRFSDSPYVFTSSQGDHLSDDAMRMFLNGLHAKRLEEDGIGWIDPVKSQQEGKPCIITAHGTARSTFRTWAKDDGLGNNRRFDQEAVELCLLHGKNDAYQGAYDRARLPKERKKVIEAWGKYGYSLIEKI